MRIIVNGCAGRMGVTLMRLVTENQQLVLAGGIERPNHPALGQDLGTLINGAATGIMASDNMLETLVNAEAVIDFSTPATSVELAAFAAQARIVHVIGTTGFSAEEDEKLQAAARHAVIIKSGNMSLGVNLLAGLVEQAAKMLDSEWDIEIIDMHHRHKMDAPSGTALLLGEAAAQGRDMALSDSGAFARHGTDAKRKAGEIGFAALRGGSVVGDHEVIFATDNEQIRFTHRAENRDIFARGALRAAQWGKDKPPGLYSMQDVLSLAT